MQTAELTAALDELRQKLNEKADKKISDAKADMQKQFDEFQVMQKRIPLNTGGKSAFDNELAEGIQKHHSEIANLKRGQTVAFQIKAVGDMTFANSFSTADASVTDTRPGIVATPARKVHIRQLLPIGTMTGSNFDFVAETGGEGSPSTVKEGNTKSQFDIDLEEKQVTAQYIAGWLRISRKMLDDVSSLTSFLQSRLLEKYLVAEDNQLLYGNGISPNLEGIITAATASTSTADNDFDLLLDDFSTLEGSNYGVSGIVINPADYFKIAQYKATGSGEYDKPGIVQFVNGTLYFDGVPVYKSTAVNSGTYLIGDFRRGAQLLMREAPRVEFFEQDETNVQKNMITVRVEGRIALPIYHTGAFITGSFTGTTT